MKKKSVFCFKKCLILVYFLVWLEKNKKIKLDLPKNYGASQYIIRLPYIRNEDPNFQNSVIDIINNRSNFCLLWVIMEEKSRKILTLLLQMENLIRLLYGEH